MLSVVMLGLVSIVANSYGVGGDETKPIAGIREKKVSLHALVGGRIVSAPGRVIESGAIVIRDGVITGLGSDVAVPEGARGVGHVGKDVVRGFIDSYSELSDAEESRGGLSAGAAYWNANGTPQLRADDLVRRNDGSNKRLREQGIGRAAGRAGQGLDQGDEHAGDDGGRGPERISGEGAGSVACTTLAAWRGRLGQLSAIADGRGVVGSSGDVRRAVVRPGMAGRGG